MGWHVFSASVAGPEKGAQPCQDASAYRVLGDRLIAVVCDGAGSAASSHLGAQLAAERVVAELVENASDVRRAIERAREALKELGARKGVPLSELAATLVGVVADAEGAWLFHIGDGVAAALGRAGEATVSPPENGEYSNETVFVTSEVWRTHLRITRASPPLRGVLLMSDGAQPFAMTRGCTAPFEPFLAPIERFLQDAREEEGSAALAALLRDPRLDAITIDDKTLLIAQWRP